MNTQELYELLSKQLAEVEARFTQQLTEMNARHTKQFETLDSRLRNVEVDVAEIKGRKAGWESALHYWITLSIVLVALGVAMAVALWK